MTDTQIGQDPPPAAPAPDRRAVTWWWIAAVFVVAVLIATLAVIFLGGRDQPTTAPPADGPLDACTVQPGPQEVPTSTPAGIEWRVSSSKVVLPYSAAQGPTREQGPLARCYAQGPLGAVLAASQIHPRALLDPNREAASRVVKEQLIPGPQRDRLLNSMASPATPPEQIQWRAFKFLSYTQNEAVIVMGFESSSGPGLVLGLPMTMTWADGDWKYNLEKIGRPYSVDSAELSTFVQWSGIR